MGITPGFGTWHLLHASRIAKFTFWQCGHAQLPSTPATGGLRAAASTLGAWAFGVMQRLQESRRGKLMFWQSSHNQFPSMPATGRFRPPHCCRSSSSAASDRDRTRVAIAHDGHRAPTRKAMNVRMQHYAVQSRVFRECLAATSLGDAPLPTMYLPCFGNTWSCYGSVTRLVPSLGNYLTGVAHTVIMYKRAGLCHPCRNGLVERRAEALYPTCDGVGFISVPGT